VLGSIDTTTWQRGRSRPRYRAPALRHGVYPQECVITTATNGPLYKGCATMKSKLLQKKSYCLNNSREGLDAQQENIEHSSLSWTGREPHPILSTRGLTPRPSRTFLPY
jgi:hypothetical protein